MKLIRSRVACLTVLACLLPLIGFGQTNLVTGTITSNTTLSGTNLLAGTVVVTNNVVLTIQPGTQVLMSNNANLVIYGQLLANGTSNQPISFTRATSAARWRQIIFRRAAASRFSHCVLEYANCGGSHLAYYDNDCNTNTVPPNRTYTEALVALGTHLDIQGCTFRNLFNSSGAPEGDAMAIISDDPQLPGTASAHVWNSQFIGIGQGIHSRHSYLLIESNYFTGHDGDNDDIDMYGESIPVPLIRHNVFLNPVHDDMINPTRCSAIIIGNLIVGGDDHGIVLRDRCFPIVMNNVISNVAQGGISVQNQCDALLINNTIVNCGRGVRLFDHFDRRVPPYCLFPGSGRATIINSVIWNSSINSLTLTDSTNGSSRVSIYHSNVEGGQASASVSANSTLTWGAGNINSDPQFTNNLRLRATSPNIDRGTNPMTLVTNFVLALTNDFDGVPRPLDGNGDGAAWPDMGAFEYLLASADSNGDGIPDGWTWEYRLNPLDTNVATANPDNDPHTTMEEWFADTNPTNAQSYFRINRITNDPPVAVTFPSSSNRIYTLYAATNLNGSAWLPQAGRIDIRGTGGTQTMTDTINSPQKFYRVGVEVP
jgi:parallel beta-helix repeat protein